MAEHHGYIKRTYGNKVLHVLYTPASNIRLYTLKGNSCLRNSAYWGVNGGWFDSSALNIAYCDGEQVDVKTNNNNWCGGGVITWNGGQFGVYSNTQNASVLPSEIISEKKTGTWAQGGHSMNLGNSNWKSLVFDAFGVTEATAPASLLAIVNTPTGRTAMVVDTITKLVYLFVTQSACTFETFRSLIQTYLEITESTVTSTRYSGLFLDGSKSSQLKAKSGSTTVYSDTKDGSDYRKLHEVIILRNSS